MRISPQVCFPFCAVTAGVVSGGASGVPVWDVLIAILASTIEVSLPQLVLALLYWRGVISKATFLGGLFTGYAWLGLFVAFLIVSPPPTGSDSPWFVYFPISYLLVLIGVVVGYLLNRFRSSKRVTAVSDKSA